MSDLRIERDDDCEMIRLSVDGVVCFEGNLWDLTVDGWVNTILLMGGKVEEIDYEYS